MPIYDYKCLTCGNTRTVTLSVTVDDYKAICSCGKEMVRAYGVGAVTFKGSGFYANDRNKK